MLPKGDQRTWSTAGHRPETQFAVWQEIVAEAFAPVRISPASPEAGFVADCGGRRLGDLTLLGLASQPQHVERTPSLIAARRADAYFLNMPVAGSGTARQAGRLGTAASGDLVLVDSDRPFRLAFDVPFAQLALVVPKPLLDPLLAEPSRAPAVALSGSTGPGALVAALLRSLAEHADTLDAREAGRVSHHLLGLLALAVAASTGPAASGRARLLQQAIDEAERSLGDPDLTAHTLAARLCISTSYLTKLFAERGLSFGRWLLARRLDRAWALLAPGTDSRTITEVAHASGFRDSAHFARAFRARFGMTPTARRMMGA